MPSISLLYRAPYTLGSGSSDVPITPIPLVKVTLNNYPNMTSKNYAILMPTHLWPE